jgi:hypothetical protein
MWEEDDCILQQSRLLEKPAAVCFYLLPNRYADHYLSYFCSDVCTREASVTCHFEEAPLGGRDIVNSRGALIATAGHTDAVRLFLLCAF